MAKPRDMRVRQQTYKGYLLETWSPTPGYYEGRVVEAPGEGYGGFNGVYRKTRRDKALAALKAMVRQHLTANARLVETDPTPAPLRRGDLTMVVGGATPAPEAPVAAKTAPKPFTMPAFKASTFELHLIVDIAKRAVKMAKAHGVDLDQATVVMDLDACHSNGCPLDLNALLAAKDGDFGHDVFGIRTNLDRGTGRLTNLFWPRHAMPSGR